MDASVAFRLPSDAHTFGDDLLKTAKESVQIKSLLPLLKEELRSKIQSRRLSEGLEELKVDFEPKEKSPLTPEEKQKMDNRKKMNRLAAFKCRMKKKVVFKNTVEELKSLMAENVRLKEAISRLEEEKEFYLTNICKAQNLVSALTELFKDQLDNFSNLKINVEDTLD